MKLIESLHNSLDKLNKPGDQTPKEPITSIYDIEVEGLDGERIDLSQYQGKHLLIVNVASRCGFTKQYKALESVFQSYGQKLQIIGAPCNQFAGQEPGSAQEIQAFCDRHFGVSFPLTQKLKVKGPEQHPLYAWLTQASQNGKMDSKVKWNFQKYLIDPQGRLVDVFYSVTSPDSNKILKHLS